MKELALYIHIPFCRKACTYCDFHFSTSLAHKSALIDALCMETEKQAAIYSAPLRSIYFGGGTPSLLEKKELQQIFNTITSNFDAERSIENTLEANPDDISAENMKLWASLGINRLSVGVQSFEKEILAQYNRSHTLQQAERALGLLRDEGMFDFTLDLIFGFPGMKTSTWERQLKKALTYKPQHISVYALTVEAKTALAHQVNKGLIKPLEDDLLEEQYLLAEEFLASEGFEHYEVSNYALPNKRAVHNSSYWAGSNYLGIGPSAHSFVNGKRWANVANNAKYEKLVKAHHVWYEEEKLSPSDRFNELLITGFRTVNGLDIKLLEQFFRSEEQRQQWWQKTDVLYEKGVLHLENNILRMNKAHWFQADGYTVDLML